MYDNEVMPVPADIAPYSTLYPSFLYGTGPPLTESVLVKDLEKYFECLTDIDRNIDDIFQVLTDRNLLDNTVLLFTSDNGFMYGEHGIKGKELPYEPSIRLPMFIRYPKWFEPNTQVTIPMGLNVDIAPTLLEAAGIDSEPYQFQGVSLHQLATGEVQRDKMLYENIQYTIDLGQARPSMRGIRSNHFKYNRYFCEEQTEEFFDLDNDPAENSNLIMNPLYAELINDYRFLLDSMRMALHDTLAADTVMQPCFLAKSRQVASVYYLEDPYPVFELLSNPFKEVITANFSSKSKGPIDVLVYNMLGQLVYQTRIEIENSMNQSTFDFDLSNRCPGIYCFTVRQNGNGKHAFIVKE